MAKTTKTKARTTGGGTNRTAAPTRARSGNGGGAQQSASIAGTGALTLNKRDITALNSATRKIREGMATVERLTGLPAGGQQQAA